MHNDTVADDALDTLAQNTGRDQVQYRLLAIDNQCMPGIVTALKAHHAGHLFGQQIDDLALAFVTPLGADDDYIFSHPVRPLSAHESQQH